MRSGSRRVGMIDPADLRATAPLRLDGGVVVEMHAHTSHLSRDSGVSAEKLLAQAVARGIDVVCLTEHNAIWSADEAGVLSEQFGIQVLPAMELGTDVGHVLVYGLARYHPELLALETLRRVVRSEGAAMVLAHPMRVHHGRNLDWVEWSEWFDGIEVINGDHSDSEDGYLVRLAHDAGVAAVGGSDAHSREAVGRAATVFPRRVDSPMALASALRARSSRAVDLRPGAAPGQPQRA